MHTHTQGKWYELRMKQFWYNWILWIKSFPFIFIFVSVLKMIELNGIVVWYAWEVLSIPFAAKNTLIYYNLFESLLN